MSLRIFTGLMLISFAFGADVMQRMEPDVPVVEPLNWAQVSRAAPSDVVKLSFVLKHEADARAKLESVFWAVSDPRNEKYGQHLSIDEVSNIIRPADVHRASVLEYLEAHGVPRSNVKISRQGDIMSVNVPVGAAEEILATEFYLWQHKEHVGKFIIRSASTYHLPAQLASSVSFVENVIRFPRLSKKPVVESTSVELGADPEFNSCGSTCAGFVTPAVLSARYALGSAPTTATVGNRVAVAEFQGEYWIATDMANFATQCSVAPFSVNTTYGGNGKCGLFNDCTESMLDVLYLGALVQPIPMDVFYSASYDLLTWIETVASTDNTPLIHSVSYGNDEAQQTGSAYMESVNTQFMAIGARGISILFASGDQGVWGREGSGTGTFNPDFPAASPYVTAVGGTNFVTKSVVGEEEAWNSSGGGFSNEFAIPSYQADAVAGYLKTATLPAAKYFNAAGRGYPDVAALGGATNPYCVKVKGKDSGVYGTSASTPVVAAIFGKLNELRLVSGGAPLGFLNPFIYQNPSAFNDVKSGNNNAGSGAGFDAIAGWDPATGLGTPNFAALAKLV